MCWYGCSRDRSRYSGCGVFSIVDVRCLLSCAGMVVVTEVDQGAVVVVSFGVVG